MNYNKLKGVLREKQFTYEMCSEALGISLVSFNSKINGKTAFTVNEARKLADILNLSNEEIIEIFLQ